jgi:hypothetical protein
MSAFRLARVGMCEQWEQLHQIMEPKDGQPDGSRWGMRWWSVQSYFLLQRPIVSHVCPVWITPTLPYVSRVSTCSAHRKHNTFVTNTMLVERAPH